MNEQIIFTADDEDPKCCRCDNYDLESDYFCIHSCGPEHGWYGYQRTETCKSI